MMVGDDDRWFGSQKKNSVHVHKRCQNVQFGFRGWDKGIEKDISL